MMNPRVTAIVLVIALVAGILATAFSVVAP